MFDSRSAVKHDLLCVFYLLSVQLAHNSRCTAAQFILHFIWTMRDAPDPRTRVAYVETYCTLVGLNLGRKRSNTN
jgi:hypothetical protein